MTALRSAVAQMARAMGAPPYVLEPDGSYRSDVPLTAFGPSLTLGGYGETPLQMATGAAVLADQGIIHSPTGVTGISNVAGHTFSLLAGWTSRGRTRCSAHAEHQCGLD